MATQQSEQNGSQKKPGRVALWIAFAFTVVFAINVVVGKIAISNGATSAPGLGDVGEFLTLFAAVVFFIAACLAHERREQGQ